MLVARLLVWSPVAVGAALLWWSQRPLPPPVEEWARLLAEHVDAAGHVDYARLATSGRQKLDAVVAQLGRVDETALGPADRRVAFWIDAHNVLIWKAVARRYPTIDSVYGLEGFHTEKAYLVAGRRVSLELIEYGILRDLTADPRVALALFRANRSSPRPRTAPYSAGDLAGALDAHERAYLADASRNRFDAGAGTIQVGAIYHRLADEFAAREGSLAAHLARVAPAPARSMLERTDALVEFLSEDHALDERPGSPPAAPLPLLECRPGAGSGTARR